MKNQGKASFFKHFLLQLFCLALCFSTTSCFDLVEDVYFNADGSGKARYMVNLSESKTLLETFFTEQTQDPSGKKVSKSTLLDEFEKMKLLLSKQPGITEVYTKEDLHNYVFEIGCKFSSVTALNNAIYTVVKSKAVNGEKVMNSNFTYTGSSFARIWESDVLKPYSEFTSLEREIVQDADVFCIYHFPKVIKSHDNSAYTKSTDGKVLILKTKAHSIATQKTSIQVKASF